MDKFLKWATVAALLLLVLVITVLAVRVCAGFDGYDPYWIDYNRPGIDITSEGP